MFMAVLVPGPVALHPLGRVIITGEGENSKVAQFQKTSVIEMVLLEPN